MAGTKQKFLITSSGKTKAQEEVDAVLNDGWRIISVTPRAVSTGKSDVTEHGAFGILFEKFFPEETL
ncbi:MAG: hypothetical protein WCG14_08360 [Chlamydiia bacterium]